MAGTDPFRHTAEALALMVASGVGKTCKASVPANVRVHPFASVMLIGVNRVVPGWVVGKFCKGVDKGSSVLLTGVPLSNCLLYVKEYGAVPEDAEKLRAGSGDD